MMDKMIFEFAIRPNHVNVNGYKYEEAALKKAVDEFNNKNKGNFTVVADVDYTIALMDIEYNIIGLHGELIFDKEKGYYTVEVELRKDTIYSDLIKPKHFKMTLTMVTCDDLTEYKTVKTCSALGLLYPISKSDLKIPLSERK